MNPLPDDAPRLVRAAATWPDMRYLAEARIGLGLAFDNERGVMVERMTIVIELKGENP